MNLFVLTCDGMPDTYIKAQDDPMAISVFESGFVSYKRFRDFRDDPSFKVRQVTLALLIEMCPEEFCLSEPEYGNG